MSGAGVNDVGTKWLSISSYAVQSCAGPDGVFVDETQRPLFLPYIDEYLRSMQGRLTEWTGRALNQVHCQHILSIVRQDNGTALSSG